MVNLFINYYNDSNSYRQAEINECFSQNLANPLIDRIYVVADNPEIDLNDFNGVEKVKIIISNSRPFFSFFFKLINENTTGGDINIISNSDIYFEESAVSLICSYISPGICFALSRWDKGINNSIQLFNMTDSQDSWVFKGPVKQIGNCDFIMGIPGCDNAIAQRIEEGGYILYNPSHDIKTIHLHNSGIRNYSRSDTSQIVDPPYKHVQPCSLQSVPVMNWITEIGSLPVNGLQSQLGEEAVIEHIFKHVETTNKYFVDLGAGAYGESTMSNTRKLIHSGWDGYGVDMNNKGESWIKQYFITPDNVLQIFAEQATPAEFDFLNIDIDSSDFWVLDKILEKYSPRCICTEYNGTLDPATSVVLKYEADYTWDETNKYGFSFAAGKKMLEKHGYRIIYNMDNQNLFALKEDIVKGMIFNVTATQARYHPENHNAIWEFY